MKKDVLLKELGNRIREIRKKNKLTQTELAHSVGKDQQSIQRLEAGNVNPTIYYLQELAEGLEVEVWQLVKL